MNVAVYVEVTGSIDATACLVIFPLPLINSFFLQSGLNKYYKFFEVIESNPDDIREGVFPSIFVVVPLFVLRVQSLPDLLIISYVSPWLNLTRDLTPVLVLYCLFIISDVAVENVDLLLAAAMLYDI